jgi:hypothetical protein
MDNVTALKALYTALGGSSDLSAANTSVEVLNAISTLLSGEGGATLNPDAIANIAAVAGGAIPHLQNKTVTPTTSKQTITAGTGYNGLGTVTVNAVTAAIDAKITAGNIEAGVTNLGVEGTYEG